MMRLILILTILLMCGCGSVQYVPVPTVQRDSIYVTRWQKDSVIVRDSVSLIVRHDTVFHNRYNLVWKDRARIDTTYIERVDTIRVPYPIEKELTRWQALKMDAGGAAIVMCIITILIICGVSVYHLRKGR